MGVSRAGSVGRSAESPYAPGKIRTCDLSLRRRALYPLSYGREQPANWRFGAPAQAATDSTVAGLLPIRCPNTQYASSSSAGSGCLRARGSTSPSCAVSLRSPYKLPPRDGQHRYLSHQQRPPTLTAGPMNGVRSQRLVPQRLRLPRPERQHTLSLRPETHRFAGNHGLQTRRKGPLNHLRLPQPRPLFLAPSGRALAISALGASSSAWRTRSTWRSTWRACAQNASRGRPRPNSPRLVVG